MAYDPQVRRIVLGEKAKDQAQAAPKLPTLDPKDIGTLTSRIIHVVQMTKQSEIRAALDGVLSEFESRRCAELNDALKRAQDKLKVLLPDLEETKAENARYRREKNEHPKVTIEMASKQASSAEILLDRKR